MLQTLFFLSMLTMERSVEEVKETTAPTNDEQNKDPCTPVEIVGIGGVEDEDKGPVIIRF